MKIISASIDLKKVDKSKLVKGKKGGVYCPITIIVGDEENQYGQDTSITMEQTKDERDAKAPRVYLGNGKVVYTTDVVAAGGEELDDLLGEEPSTEGDLLDDVLKIDDDLVK